MIKFRCPVCGQKIAVNDEGAGVTIGCPNCQDAICIPPETALEFRAPAARPAAIPVQFNALPPVLALGRERQMRPLDVEPVPLRSSADTRAALMPHLARLMMDKVVQALFSQRAHLMDTQHDATKRVVELEQRMLKAQQQLQQRLAFYEQRIRELEGQLVLKEKEVYELKRNNLVLVRQSMEAQDKTPSAAVPVESRDAAVLV